MTSGKRLQQEHLWIRLNNGQSALFQVKIGNLKVSMFSKNETATNETANNETAKRMKLGNRIRLHCPGLKPSPFCFSTKPKEQKPLWNYYTNCDKTELYVSVAQDKGSDVFYFKFSVSDEHLREISKKHYDGSKIILRPENLISRKASSKECEQRSSLLLAKIKAKTEIPDFTIRSKEGVNIKVHSSVMKTKWPFFEMMMQHDCKEKTEQVLKLDFSAAPVELLVSYIYGLKPNLSVSLEEAMAVAEMAAMYNLQELEQIAMKVVERTTATAITSLLGSLRFVYHQQDKENRDRFALAVMSELIDAEKMSNSETPSALSTLSPEKFLRLFADAMGAKSTSTR